MGYSRGIQIDDLEAIQSDLEQELTIEDAKKVVGGCFSSNDRKCKIQVGKASIIKIHIPEPKPNPNPPIIPEPENFSSLASSLITTSKIESVNLSETLESIQVADLAAGY